MKRHLIYLLGALLAVVSYGCTSDDDVQSLEREMTIRLTMASEMNTRSPRPLEGVDSWQHVTDVRVYLFRSDTEDGMFTLQSWPSEDGTKKNFIDVEAFKKTAIYKEEDFEQHTVVVKTKLKDGYYRLLAIGVDEDENLFDVIPNIEETADGDETTEGEVKPDPIKWDEVLKTFNEGPITNEFFSGYSETVHISSSIDKNFISIELKRCVAGVLLYVKNIPETIDGKDITSIKLILSGYSKTTDIVNRTWKSDAVESEIELAKFSANDAIKTEDGTHPEEGMYYAGKFILPSNTGIQAKTSESTLKLVYYKDNKVVKSKRVVMLGDQNHDYDYDYENPDLSIDKKHLHYNLLANHIYCIGFRSDEKKEPIDLSDDSDEVKIIAYGSWQADVDITL